MYKTIPAITIRGACLYLCLLLYNTTYSQIKSEKHLTDFSFTCFQNKDKSWGYDILSSGKLFIHQPIIPALPGQKGFDSKHSASIVAELAIKKLKEKPNEFPTIIIEELKKLKIII